MKVYEIESKFKINDEDKVNDFLTKSVLLKKGHQEDIYYDNKNADFFLKAIFLRIRNNQKIDFKYSLDLTNNEKHDGCLESSFKLPLKLEKLKSFNKIITSLGFIAIKNPDINEFFDLNNLEVFVPIIKEYTLYEMNGFKFRFDKVKDLEDFLEIEKIVKDIDKVDITKKKIIEIEKELNLEFVNAGYVELYLRKRNFDLYIKGPFVLDKDKITT